MRTTSEVIMDRFKEDFGKALTSGYDFSHGSLTMVPFPDAVKVWGGVQTPLLDRIGDERAVAITDKWEDAQVSAVAENAQVEGIKGRTLTGVSVLPVVRTNTCQIASDYIPITGSAIREARNGVYGRALQDLLQFQVNIHLPQMVASIAWSAWFSVEVTAESAAEGSARKMAGLVGTVGSAGFDDGLLTTTGRATVTDGSGGEFTQSMLDNWLMTIAAAGAGAANLPTALYCSLTAQAKLATFDNTLPVESIRQAGGDIMAGSRVTKYWAPWGAALDIVWEPQNAHSGTAANNWIAALCEPNLAMRSLSGSPTESGIELIPLPVEGDQSEVQFLWEGCVKAEVWKGHGVLKNFTVTLPS